MTLQRHFAIALTFLCIAALVPAQQPKARKGGKRSKAVAAQQAAAKPKGKKDAPPAAPTPSPKLEKIQPYLTIKGDPAHSIMVNWWNPIAAGDSRVAYGATAQYGATASDPTTASTHFHHVELTGLTPGATYHYQIRSSDGTAGEDNTFTLPEEHDTDFTFAVCGDSRNGGKASDLTDLNPKRKTEYDAIAAKAPGFVINVGDVALRGGNAGDWTYFFNCEQNALKHAPYMIAMGNHEVSGKEPWPGGFLYYNFFAAAYPANGTPGDSGQPTALGMNYSFTYGNAHFVFLSSMKMTPESQVAWLERDLTAAKADPKIKWLFAVMHAPLYTWATGHPGEEKELAAWGPLFDKYHVDLVFAGHNHIYERSHVIKGGQVVASEDAAQGTIYMTCGLGGAPHHEEKPANPKYPFIQKWYNATTAASFFHVTGGKLEMKTLDPQGKEVDALAIDKDGGAKP